MQSSLESQISQLNRRVVLLDEYCLTLQKQNLAKNNQTQTLYRQLNDVRMQNEILKNHIDRLLQQQTQQNLNQGMNFKRSQINCSVELDCFNANSFKSITNQLVQQFSVLCQTQHNQLKDTHLQSTNIHLQCTKQLQSIFQSLKEKQNKLTETINQSREMYDILMKLEDQNQKIKEQLHHKDKLIVQNDKKVKLLKQELKKTQDQNTQYKQSLQELNQRLQSSSTSQQQSTLQHYQNIQAQSQRLIKQNNKLILQIRILQKQKNSYYKQLKTISPLRDHNRATARSNLSPLKKMCSTNSINVQKELLVPSGSKNMKSSFLSNRITGDLTLTKEKNRIKNQRWKIIQDKINMVKSQNQHIRANLQLS